MRDSPVPTITDRLFRVDLPRIPVAGGTAAAVLDFSNDAGGAGDYALSAVTLPIGGRLLVAHVSEADRDNPAVAIPARAYTWPSFEVDARCRACPARSEISFNGDEAMLLIVHRGNGCAELAAIRELLDEVDR
jgi:hypothetical protein